MMYGCPKIGNVVSYHFEFNILYFGVSHRIHVFLDIIGCTTMKTYYDGCLMEQNLFKQRKR